MAKRRLNNWLEAYKEYTLETEPPRHFHNWTSLSAISAALRKKVWFKFGRLRIHPNLYVVLVSEPGIARKTQAISYAEELISEVSGRRTNN
jgi:hypothetical protein